VCRRVGVDLCVDAGLDARLYEHMKVFVSAILLVALLCESAAAEDGEAQFSSEQITRGAALFARHCATCHGTRMRNPQWAVNLRDFPGPSGFSGAINKRDDLLGPLSP
jgi:hypothetical protein